MKEALTMYDDKNTISSALVEVCRKFIEYLDSLLENGLISEAEYHELSRVKVNFIKEMNNWIVSFFQI